jgi:formate hydrogenlyase subunit 6/NADH:ubiquinone oxidoreductase subunit I
LGKTNEIDLIDNYICSMTYFSNIGKGIKTTIKGMSLTLKHLWQARVSKGHLNLSEDAYFELSTGNVTLQYPHQEITVPDHGRYKLDCEIDDCIVCDKCAKICPVDCIEIEAVKSSELIRTTSDGSPVRLYAAKFDIDMAKCCFCGLCTTVCPTECLTMDSNYDYAVLDITQLNFAFSNLSEEEITEKKELYEQFVAEKEAAKQLKASTPKPETEVSPKVGFKPNFKPKMAPAIPPSENAVEGTEKIETAKPAFVPKNKPQLIEPSPEVKASFSPKIKPVIAETQSEAKPVFKPTIKPKTETPSEDTIETKKAFMPKIKPSNATNNTDVGISTESVSKPAFKLTLKPKMVTENSEPEVAKAPAFVPKIKPKTTEASAENISEPVKAFVPKLKPKKDSEITEAKVDTENKEAETEKINESVKAFVPKLKPKHDIETTEDVAQAKPKAFVPKLKPKAEEQKTEGSNMNEAESAPKAKFVPKLKPKS